MSVSQFLFFFLVKPRESHSLSTAPQIFRRPLHHPAALRGKREEEEEEEEE